MMKDGYEDEDEDENGDEDDDDDDDDDDGDDDDDDDDAIPGLSKTACQAHKPSSCLFSLPVVQGY